MGGLPWIWILEILSRSDQVDIALLLDLAKKCPEISDYKPFLVQKRSGSGLTMCSLHKLKDAILGQHPSLESLKVKSGLADENEHLLPVKRKRSSSIGNAIEKSCKNHIILERSCNTCIKAVEKYKPEIISRVKDVRAKLISLGMSTQTTDALAPIVECTEGEWGSLEEETHVGIMGQKEPAEDHSVEFTSSKELIGHAVLPCEQQVPHDDTEAPICKPDMKQRKYGKGTRCNLKKKTHVQNIVHNRRPGDGNNEYKSESLAGHDEALPCQKQAPRCDIKVPDDKFEEQQVQNHDIENSESDTEGFHELKTTNEIMGELDQNIHVSDFSKGELVDNSSDIARYHVELSDIARKRNAFLSSLSTFSQDFLATDWRERNICVKCNKGGKLLVCCSKSCPLVIHESCLVSDVNLDSKGQFNCPFCAYSRAILDCMETKKKASLAKEVLASFISAQTSKESTIQPCISFRINKNHVEQDVPERNELNDINFVKKVNVNKPWKEMELEQAGPSALGSGDSLPFGGKNVESPHKIPHVLHKDKQEGTHTIQLSQSLRDRGKFQMAATEIFKSQGDNVPCQIPESSERHAEIGPKKGSSPECPPSVKSADAEEVSEADEEKDEENSGVSKNLTRVRKQENQNSYLAVPQSKRKRLPWSEAEEEKLKEAMQTICRPDDKSIKWKKIMQFGAGTFSTSRTTVDLKDKWRNICKAAHKSE